MKRRELLIGGAAAMLAAGLPARAQGWPERPIRLIVPYPAGGNSDSIGRFVGERVGQALGQPVVVENRAGAGATIGAQVAANANPDGYTWLLAPTAVLAITPHRRKVPYEPGDLTPVAKLSGSYGLVIARKDLPADNVEQLIALARKEPGRLTFGSAGTATITHLTGEIFALATGVKLLHVPYKGSAPALTDLIGGQVQLFFDAASGLIEAGKSGRVRLIGVASDKRLPVLPDVPTFEEQGIKNFTGSTWAGMLAPAGTPTDIVDRMAREIAPSSSCPMSAKDSRNSASFPPAARRIRSRSSSGTKRRNGAT